MTADIERLQALSAALECAKGTNAEDALADAVIVAISHVEKKGTRT